MHQKILEWISAAPLAIFAAFSLSSPAFAETPIHDPRNLLPQIDAFVAGGRLAQAFHCGDQMVLKRLNRDCRFGCSDTTPDTIGGCAVVCQKAQDLETTQVTACEADSATVANGDGSEIYLTAPEFSAISGNLLRRDLASLDEYTGLGGTVELLSIKTAPQKLASGKEVEGMEVQARLRVSRESMAVDYVIARNVPGVAQILFKRLSGAKMFRVQDFSRP